MADAEAVKPGDKVSWSWGAGQPAGKAAEVKEDTVTMTTARGNEVKKDGEPGDPAVRVERSGHDVVKKASELEVEKPGPAHGGGANKDGEKKDGGVTQNDEGKDVAKDGKPDGGTKEEHAQQKQEAKAEAKKAETTKANGKKSATPAPAPSKAAEKPEKKAEAKGKPGPKPKGPPKAKAEKLKRKAATESGEPRRSKRIRGGE